MKTKNCLSVAGKTTKTHTKVNRILPIKGSKYDSTSTLVRDMKTVGLELNAAQATSLVIQLLMAVEAVGSSDRRIRITGHRKNNCVTTLILQPLLG